MRLWGTGVLLVLLVVAAACQKDEGAETQQKKTEEEKTMTDQATITFHPIEHASLVIKTSQAVIYVDPVGEENEYKDFEKPDILLITHTHHDHLQPELVAKLKTDTTIVIGNADAVDAMGHGEAMKNGESKGVGDIKIEATAMYNLTEERLKFHPKGVGNGYVLNVDGERIYIAGDTEDIPEMRALKDIDYAFVCMNLPYTMTVEKAADAVLEFRPKTVFPYHFRGKEGKSDMEAFSKLVAADPGIKVEVLDWYQEKGSGE